MANLHAQLPQRVDEVVMRTFPQRIRVGVHERHLWTQRRNRHKESQHRTGVADIQLLDVLRPTPKSGNDDLLLVLFQYRAQIGDAAAHGVAVLAMRRIINGACPFRQSGNQQVTGRIIFGR
ncbi:hypothetical protein D3C81_1151030 [compost metagenome]